MDFAVLYDICINSQTCLTVRTAGTFFRLPGSGSGVAASERKAAISADLVIVSSSFLVFPPHQWYNLVEGGENNEIK
nr:hypothetical protein [Dialister invisus]